MRECRWNVESARYHDVSQVHIQRPAPNGQPINRLHVKVAGKGQGECLCVDGRQFGVAVNREGESYFALTNNPVGHRRPHAVREVIMLDGQISYNVIRSKTGLWSMAIDSIAIDDFK